jgi:hypothetical protein
MSSKLVKAHGGSKMLQSVEGGGSLTLGGIVHKTTKNVQQDVHMRDLPKEKPIMSGVIASTIPMSMKSVPEYHKVPSADIGKTKAKRMGQVPFAGKMY